MVPNRPSRARMSVLRRTPLMRLKRRLPRETLRRHPFLARAGGNTMGGPLPGGRATRGVGVLVCIFLLLAAGRQYTMQTLDVSAQIERVVRGQLIPQFEKQYGIKIEVGAIESDWLSRIVLRDVMVDADGKLPTGALARVKSITVSADLLAVALKRETALQALHSVYLDSPQIYLFSDEKRQWNFDKFLKGPQKISGLNWMGTVTWTNGRVYLRDEAMRSARNEPLVVDAKQIEGVAKVAPMTPVLATASAGRTVLGDNDVTLEPVSAQASYDLARHALDLNASVTKVPAAYVVDYLLPKRQARVTSGTATGVVQLVLRGKKFVPYGQVQLTQLAGELPVIKGLNRDKAVKVTELSGPLAFSGLAFTSTGLNAVAAGIPVHLRGDVAIPDKPVFNLEASSTAADHRKLLALLPANVVPVGIEAKPLQLDARVSGDFTRWTATGTGVAPGALVTSAKLGRARAALARFAFAVSREGHDQPRVAARYALDGVSAAATQGSGEAKSAEGTLKYDGGPVQVAAVLRGWAGHEPKYGQVSGPELRIEASAAKPNGAWAGGVFWQGADMRGVKLASLGQAATLVQRTGTVDASLRFWDVNGPHPRVSGPVRLASAVVQVPELGVHTVREARGDLQFADGNVRLSALRAQSDLGPLAGDLFVPKGGAPRVALMGTDLRVPTATLNTVLEPRGLALTGEARGTVSLTSPPQQDGALEASFRLALPANSLRTGGVSNAELRNSVLEGVGHYNLSSGLWDASGTLDAGMVTLHAGKLGKTTLAIPPKLNGVRAAGIRVKLAGSGARSAVPEVSGSAALDRLAIPGLALPGQNAKGFTLQKVAAEFKSERGGMVVPRLAAMLGEGKLAGEATLGNNGTARGEFLVSGMQAGSLQTLLFPSSVQQARFEGRLNARISLTGGPEGYVPKAHVVLKDGSVKSADGEWPLDVAEGEVALTPDGKLAIQQFALWSRGGRLAADGTLGPLPGDAGPGFVGKLSLSNFRVGDLATLPALTSLRSEAKADGLVSGSFDAVIARQASLKGPVTLRLATLFGLDVTELKGTVSATSDNDAFRLTVADVTGKVEGADITGQVAADTGKNFWHVVMKSTPVSAVRVARARSIRPETLPVRGDFSIDTDVSGTLREANHFAPKPKDGFVKISTGPLTWRGRPLGALNADLTAQDGLLVARQFQLTRPQDNGPASPLITVTGRLPLAADDPGLNAEVKLADAPVDFVFEVMTQVRDVLKAAETPVPLFEKAVDFVNSLPPGTTGRISAQADLVGQWDTPLVKVTSLTLKDGRARVPAGGLSPPASLDAAFTYQKGLLTISKAAFRMQKTGASPTASADPDEDNSTLIQLTDEGSVVAGGPVKLSGQVLNANLAELATWIPALRGRDGRPILSGGISEFTITASGTTDAPQVTGSVEATQLAFDTYMVDTLRVNRFDIRDGFISIEPRSIALAKGNFRSVTSVSGRVPWSWTLPGPVRDAPMEVHLPFTQDDFALIGLLLPALQAAQADAMAGAIEINGTLNDPKWTGSVQVKGGKFRLDPIQTALEVGVSDLNGTVRFAPGNRLEIDADDPLRGRLISARAVKATEVRRKRREKDADAPELDGNFSLKGGVTYDPVLANWVNPREAFIRQRYDLTLTLENGKYSSPLWNGLHNAALAVIWRTGPAPYADNQTIRWMLAAEGNGGKLKGGSVSSVGALQLDPESVYNPRRIGTSRALDFTGEEDFAGFAVAKRINLTALPDRRCQLDLDKLAIGSQDIGTGLLDGRLVLDNRSSTQQASKAAVDLRRVAFTDRLRSYRKENLLLGVGAGERFREVQDEGATVPLRDLQPIEAREEDVLRLGGSLTLSNADLKGVPAGGGIPVRLSVLPAAPLFDIRIVLGNQVTVAVATMRATLDGTVIIGGTPQDPQIYGTLATIEGQVRFPNARARLEEGNLTVSGQRDPATDTLQIRAEVDVTARGQVKEYEITLHVRGPLDVGDTEAQNLRVDVSSNPPLPQSEAFAQLLGTSSRGLSGNEMDNAYGRAVLQVVSAPLFSGVERSVATALGLTAINFDYRFDSSLGVELSKNLGHRLIVSYSRSLSGTTTDGGHLPFQIRLDYRLKGNLLTGVQTDEQDVRKITLQKTWHF